MKEWCAPARTFPGVGVLRVVAALVGAFAWLAACVAGVAASEVARITQAFQAAIAHPSYETAIRELGFDLPTSLSPAAIEARVRAESDRWSGMIGVADFKVTE